MKIKYKGIINNHLHDAPFVGTIIISPYCHKYCNGCHNEHLRDDGDFPILTGDVDTMLDMIKSNLLDVGIILSGLEWTDTPKDMLALIQGAMDRDLEIMLYTHMQEEDFLSEFSQLRGSRIWVKFGEFDEGKKTDNNKHCDINLATENQYIKFLGEDTL